MKKILLFLLFTFQLNGQELDIKTIMNLVINEEIPENFTFFNLVDTNLIDRIENYSLPNSDKRELLSKYLDFPIDLIINPKIDSTKRNWTNYNLNKAKVNSEYICKEIVKNQSILFRAKNQKEYDSIVSKNLPNLIAIIINPKWSERKINSKIKKAYELHQPTIQKIENKVYFHFTYPIFSKEKGFFRITIFESKSRSGIAKTFIYKIENNKILQVYEYGRWTTVTTTSHTR